MEYGNVCVLLLGALAGRRTNLMLLRLLQGVMPGQLIVQMVM